MPYTKTVWANNVTPALNATNLNHLTDVIKAQALAKGVAHSLPTWANGVPPAVSEAAPLNEIERVVKAVQVAAGAANYTVTTWQANWTPARNAVNLNKLEEQVRLNQVAIDGAPTFPASYYTGPLAANNILPTTTTGALVIMWHAVEATSTLNRAGLVQRATDCGRARFDGVGIHYGGIDSEIPGRGGGSMGSGGEAWAHSVGSIPIVSWTRGRYTKGTTNLCTMTEINNGLHDAIIIEAVTYWKNLGYRVMWRPFWEFDGTWFPWSPTAGNANDGFPNAGCTFAAWIAAWQRVAGLVAANGAGRVGLWWCPTAWFSGTTRTACYPGDAYVDWVGADGYNQADDQTGTYCGGGHPVQTSPLHSGWAEFWELYNPTGHGTSVVSVHDEFGPSKPFVVGETNSLYDGLVGGTDVNKKANWYRNINTNAFALPDMPYLKGIQFFDANLVASEGFDWRVDSNQTYLMKEPVSCGASTVGSVDSVTYQGFKDFAGHANWTVGVVGGAT